MPFELDYQVSGILQFFIGSLCRLPEDVLYFIVVQDGLQFALFRSLLGHVSSNRVSGDFFSRKRSGGRKDHSVAMFLEYDN